MENPGIEGRIIFKLDLQEVECKGMGWTDLVQDRHTWAGSSECSNEPSGSIKCRVFAL